MYYKSIKISEFKNLWCIFFIQFQKISRIPIIIHSFKKKTNKNWKKKTHVKRFISPEAYLRQSTFVPFFFFFDDLHITDTFLRAMTSKWKGKEVQLFCLTTGSLVMSLEGWFAIQKNITIIRNIVIWHF